MSEERKVKYQEYFSNLPVYKKITINDTDYVLTHSGYVADEPPVYLNNGMVDIVVLIEQWCKTSEYIYLISCDLHFILASVKFMKTYCWSLSLFSFS